MSHLKANANSVITILIVAIAVGCGSSKPKFEKSPVDEYITSFAQKNIKEYSIILLDMNYDESSSSYMHKYKVLLKPVGKDTLIPELSDWNTVSDVFFNKHLDHLGMELVNCINGVVSKQVSPAGHSNYVGNERYGSWQRNSNGTSFWAFYGQYMFMSSIFRMATYPVRYSHWNDYRSNYYHTRRPYYGSGGQRYYGTGGSYNAKTNASSKWANKPSDFKSKVRSKVARSSKVSRASSRYSTQNNGSMRSRSGGFGK